MVPHLVVIYKLIFPESGDDDRSFRMQFNLIGKLQPFFLFLELSIIKIKVLAFSVPVLYMSCLGFSLPQHKKISLSRHKQKLQLINYTDTDQKF